MADRFLINGGKPLGGIVEVSGSKNAAGAILAATLLTEEECIIGNIPKVLDILNLLKILENMGVEISWDGESKVRIKAGENIDPQKMEFDLVGKSRISVLLMGGLLARFREFKISPPGGDRIGLRPIKTHLKSLEKLGVEISYENNFYYFKAKNLRGSEVILNEFSVTATENLIMAAALTPGKTTIMGAAAEPHVQDLGEMLQKMGAQISGHGTHTVHIKGVEKLKGVAFEISPDPIEAGTFIVAGGICPGEIEIKNCIPSHLSLFLAKLEEIGVSFQKGSDFIKVKFSPGLRSARIQALPYPGFQTDLIPVILPLLTQATGKSLVHDPLYENRLNFTQELRRMGADIEIVDPHRAFVFGPTPLRGVRIESGDIRAGASLILGALIAKGQSEISNVYQIDRGYEKIEEKLQKLGADIRRIKE